MPVDELHGAWDGMPDGAITRRDDVNPQSVRRMAPAVPDHRCRWI